MVSIGRFQHTAARRRLGLAFRPSAKDRRCFNTQPPEGGWQFADAAAKMLYGFNTQPPEGGWEPLRSDRTR